MKLLSRILLTLLVTALALAGPASAADLTPHRAQYKVKISVISGELSTELRSTDDGFVALHIVKPKGMARVLTDGKMRHSSTFLTEIGGVKPVSYHAIDTITDDPEERISFDWTTNQASGTVGDQEVLLQLDGVSHDNVSIQYQLMHDLLNGGPRETYIIFDVDKMRVADVRNVGTRTVKTKAGNFEVVGIQHQKEGSARITTLWCAKELDYLPVIIEQHRLGKLKFRASLTSYTPT